MIVEYLLTSCYLEWTLRVASLRCGKLLISSQCSSWLESVEMQPNLNWWSCNWILPINTMNVSNSFDWETPNLLQNQIHFSNVFISVEDM